MITSVSNAKIKNVMQLNQKAKARREQGLFVAEGRKMFWKHRKAGFPRCLSPRPFPRMES